MRILVAGGTGFIGQSIVSAFQLENMHEVVTTSRSKSGLPGIRHISCDWRDVHRHADVLAFSPHVILNAVGDQHPRKSLGKESQMLEQHLLPFFRLLDGHRQRALRRVLFVSSAGSLYNSSIDTRQKQLSDSAYFSIKLATETLLESYSAVHNIQAISIRISNPVGDHDKVDFGVVNHFARALLKGDDIEFFGDYRNFKDYIDVQDAGSGLAQVAGCPLDTDAGTLYDLGSGMSFSAEGICETLRAIMSGEKTPSYLTQISQFPRPLQDGPFGWNSQHNVLDAFARVIELEKQRLAACT